MKPIPAIVEPAQIDLDLIDRQLAVEIAGERDDIRTAERHESEATRHVGAARAARESAAARRKRIGAALCKARPLWPARGFAPKNAKLPPGAPPSWAEYLKRHGLDDATARRYMDEYRDPETFAQKQRLSEGRPTAKDGADDDEPFDVIDQQRDTPPFRQMTEGEWIQGLGRLSPDVRSRIMAAAGPLPAPTPALALTPEPDPDDTANVHGGSHERERGTWCTSKEWAAAVGPWDLDPFSNPRSHILSVVRCMLEDGGDAFGGGSPGRPPGVYLTGNARGAQPASGCADELTRVWIQPPYEMVAAAIAHYGHTRFCALLRWSPDVKAWFPELWKRTAVVCHPWGERMEFEPPPGKKKSGDMPFPHALYYAHEADVTDEVRAKCIVWRVDHDFDPRGEKPALQLVR